MSPIRLLLPVIAALALSACNSVPRTQMYGIEVLARDGANADMATALSLVFVYNAQVLALLPKDAAGWQAQGETLHANQWPYIDVVRLQVPPAFLVRNVALPQRFAQAIKVIAYAEYVDPAGREPVDLTGFKHPRIILGPHSVAATEQ